MPAMAAIKSLFLALYGGMLALYPVEFRQTFAEEMSLDFEDALQSSESIGLGMLLSVFLREVVDWPVCLLREYRQMWRGRREMASNNLNQLETNGSVLAAGGPGGSWAEAVLAALPYVLILAFMSTAYLLNTLLEAGSLRQGMNTFSGLLLVPILILVFVLAWRRRWPVWTGSWMVPFLLMLAVPLSLLIDQFANIDWFFNDLLIFLVLPLLLAVLLYRVTRRDRLQGLLAAAPLLYLLWTPNMESVPEYLTMIIYFSSVLMVMVCILAVVRLGSWTVGLALLLVTFIAVGLQFSYLGIYHGGTLPYSAPGPSLLEVFKSFLPQYLLVGAILLGPLLARNIREIGLRSGRTGAFSYRLALLGMLVLIGVHLVGLLAITTDRLRTTRPEYFQILDALVLAGLGLYVLGVLWLYRAAASHQAMPDRISAVMLAVLLPLLPFVFALPFFTYTRTPSRVLGVPFLYGLPDGLVFGIGLAWLLACVWLVFHMGEPERGIAPRSAA
jgi:hypothetical protein